MAKKPNIKWRKSDAEKLDAAIKSFNKKIYNTRQRKPDVKNILPDTIKNTDKQRMIEEFKNLPRNEFNKQLRSLERFVDNKKSIEPVKAESGNTVTRWEKQEVGYKVAQINRDRAKQRKDFDTGTPGKYTRKMGDFKENELKPKPFNFDKIKGGKEWAKFKLTVDKQSNVNYKFDKMDKYKENYLSAIELNLKGDGQELYDLISKIPADKLYENYWMEDGVLRIQFTSEPLPSEQIVSESVAHWNTALGEDYIRSLDNDISS